MKDKINSTKRNNIIKKNIIWSFILKIIGVGMTFLLLPLTVNYLTEVEYGIWTTLFSVMNWINLLDIGLGLGLRNKLTEAVSKKNSNDICEYISTGFFSIFFIGVLLWIIFYICIHLVSLQNIFNTTLVDEEILYKSTIWTGSFVIASFVLSIINQVFYAYQKAAVTGAINITHNAVMLLAVYYLTFQSDHNLVYFVFAFGIAMLSSRVIFIYLFFRKRTNIIPWIDRFDLKKIKEITSLGIKFFVIQICTIVGFSFSDFMITLYLGPEYVRTYDIVFKIMNISMMCQTIILTPLWSAYTDAYVKKDYRWITSIFQKTCKLSALISFLLILIAFLLDDIVDVWLHIRLEYTTLFIVFMLIYHVLLLFVNDFCMLLNGLSKVDIQMYVWIFAAIIVVPISYTLIHCYNFNIEAIIIAMTVSTLVLFISLPIQIKHIFKGWGKSYECEKNM